MHLPTRLLYAPTDAPTPAPTYAPTDAPTPAPTYAPTDAPTTAPTYAPTPAPTYAPTDAPTTAPATTAPISCPMGQFDMGLYWKWEAGSGCYDCHSNYYCPGDNTNMLCPLGYYCPTNNLSSPIICPAGNYCTPPIN